jgi:hypothetical protein
LVQNVSADTGFDTVYKGQYGCNVQAMTQSLFSLYEKPMRFRATQAPVIIVLVNKRQKLFSNIVGHGRILSSFLL